MPYPAILLDFRVLRIGYYPLNPFLPDFRVIAPGPVFIVSGSFNSSIIPLTTA